MDALDKEEREERELAARRAQFLLGAEMDDEQLDWSESMGGAGSDDEMDGAGLGSGGDRDAEDAARRVLATATADGDGVAEPAKPEPTWADLDGFVPPGHAGSPSLRRRRCARQACQATHASSPRQTSRPPSGRPGR